MGRQIFGPSEVFRLEKLQSFAMKTNARNENEGHTVHASKTKREPLKALQKTANNFNNKENFAGRVMVYKDAKSKDIELLCKNCTSDLKRSKYVDKGAQAGDKPITAEDLMSKAEPSAEYWRQLAETRGKALEESLKQNQKLQDLYETLQEENKICNRMLDESRHLVEVLKEIMAEGEEEETTEETPSGA